MIQLTRAEEQVMQIIWKLEKAFVKEIIAEMEEPKPAYTTVSTVVRTLEKKGIVGYEQFGNTYRYHSLVPQHEYSKQSLNRLVNNYFGGSLERLVSFFAKQNNPDIHELDAIRKLMEEELSKKEQKDG